MRTQAPIFAVTVFALATIGFGAVTPVRAAEDAPKPAATAKKGKDAKPPAEDPEIKMGRETHEDLLRSGLKLVKDPEILARVEGIGKKVAAIANDNPIPAKYGSSKHVPYEYRFFVVDDDDVNAFSLPGGYIYINKGILRYSQSDDELAGVIGHEIAHAAHHHVAKLQREQSRLNTQMAIGLLAALVARVPTADTMNLMTGFQLIALQKVNGFSQDAERDADYAGVILAQKAGYNPVGSLTFMERLGRDQKQRPDVEMGIFRTHPPEKERSGRIEAQITEMGLPVKRRDVTNTLRVSVRPVTPKAGDTAATPVSEVLLDGKLLYSTPSADRAQTVAETVNKLLDQNLQIYDLTRQGANIYARGKTVISVRTDDMPAYGATTPTPTPETVADSAFKTLRNALYRHLLNGGVY